MTKDHSTIMKIFKDRSSLQTHTISNSSELSISFFAHGGLFQVNAKGIMVNQVLGHPIDGSMQNLYLRIKTNNHISYYPLLGPTANNECSVGSQSATWTGEIESLHYSCSLVLDEKELAWNWNVDINNLSTQDVSCDVIYTQDLGLANEGSVRINEAYCSQYIDHHVFDTDNGYAIASRQNQKTSEGHTWIIQGSLQKNIGYVTDGFSFYGLSYKETGVPQALLEPRLCSEKSQYELAFIALQSEEHILNPGSTQSLNFFAQVQLNHPLATSDEDISAIKRASAHATQRCVAIEGTKKDKAPSSLFNKPLLFTGDTLSAEERDAFFPGNKRHEEREGKTLLSFFYDDHSYVTLKEKELCCERPHGHILRSGQSLEPGNDNILSTTSYMYGVFHSHLTLGNTSFNKFLSIMRSPLNIFKSSGQRVFVKIDKQWELLGLPSAYEVSRNHAKWIYRRGSLSIIVRSWTIVGSPVAHFSIETEAPLEFLISHNLTLGNNEWENEGSILIDNTTQSAILRAGQGAMLNDTFPEASFHVTTCQPDMVAQLGTDKLLLEEATSQFWPYLVYVTHATKSFSLSFTGDLYNEKDAANRCQYLSQKPIDFTSDYATSDVFWKELSHHFDLSINDNEDILKIKDVLLWYMHNAMIHYSTPHGLEQFSGAAWGVRDVCQGPIELFLATGNMAPVRSILKMVFEQQYIDTGDWPQWFMFDRYVKIQHAESHGDIVIWPLKALSMYIEASNDLDFLNEELCYTNAETFDRTETKEPLLAHVQKTIQTIEDRFIPDTALSCYGEGDWDDTLQPANEDMRKNMVSAWTVSLTYQTFSMLKRVFEQSQYDDMVKKLTLLTNNIQKDFNKYLVKDNITSGFVYFNEDKSIDYMIHPSDKKLGLTYRLLPMTRSMIAELFTPEQMKAHCAIIDEYLTFPDGVRLTDTPVSYGGGPRIFFRRADEAANFGREIGLQYVHAHIRYIEAMCKIGDAKKAYDAILKIIPITIQKAVPNAMIRQSNAYFSSSDGNFKDRYEAKQLFSKLKDGSIGVKGGWRIYSSGPGIFLSQVINNFIGLRSSFGDIVIDPVLPKSLDGLISHFTYNGKNMRFTFNIAKDGPYSVKEVLVNNIQATLTYEDNPYRQGGVRISGKEWKQLLTHTDNNIKIHIR
jgi:cellobiose phosphorylase